MTQPDDRELEQYLAGDSKLSRRYRDASAESAPPELDEAILAQARAELKRKPPSLNRILAPVALAASVVLGVNLAWNLYQVEPLPDDLRQPQAKAQSRDNGPSREFVPLPPPTAAERAPDAPAPQPERKARVAQEPPPPEADAIALRKESERRLEQEALSKRESEERAAVVRSPEDSARSFSAAPAPRAADHVPSEAQKIDALVRYVAGLENAVFIRNGKEYGPPEAAKHLQLKREKAGGRCATAEAFIRVCASFSSMSGEAYLIRFADGRTRTAEDVLREFLRQMEAAP